MGLVYAARDLRLERPVAIKIPPAGRSADPEFRARFLREARTAAGLSHPSIVPIYTAEEIDDFLFIAMAYVAGESLAQRVERRGALSVAETVRLLRELAEALSYAHRHGVVHRDVKPDNILIEAATGRALLSDFGIAYVARTDAPTRMTPEGVVRGTAAFMSPEQARGQPVDARSDLYSLGLVGYYALTAHVPFHADSERAVLALQVSAAPPSLDPLNLPGPLARALTRCLAKRPDARPRDGAALSRELATIARGAVPFPIAIRAFLTRSHHLAGPALLYEVLVGFVALPAVAWCWLFRGPALMTGLESAALAVLVVVPAAVAWSRARGLLRQGIERGDLTAALASEREQRLEELEYAYGRGPSRLERGAAWVCRTALGAAVGLAAAGQYLPLSRLWAGSLACAGVSLVAGMVARWRTEHRTDPRGARRQRFWAGLPGRLVFLAARLGLPTGTPAASVVPRVAGAGVLHFETPV